MPESADPKFCPRCGAAIAGADGAGRPRCGDCGFVHYRDPKLSAVVLVEDGAGRLLYVLRDHEPAMGEWAWPSGFVDAGEAVEAAAAREVLEETGLEVEIGGLLGIWSRAGDAVVAAAYRARAIGGSLQAGPETRAAEWRAPGALPEPAFPHDAEILAAWRRARER